MNQKLMVLLETEKDGQRFSFSVQQHSSFKSSLESLHEFQGMILEWQRIAEERAADAAELESQQKYPKDSAA